MLFNVVFGLRQVALEPAEGARLVLSHMVGFMGSDAEQLGLHSDEL